MNGGCGMRCYDIQLFNSQSEDSCHGCPRVLCLLNLYWLLNCCTSCCGQCTMMYNFQSINQCDKAITHFFQDVHEMHHSKKLYITYRAHDVQLFFHDTFHVHPSKQHTCNVSCVTSVTIEVKYFSM